MAGNGFRHARKLRIVERRKGMRRNSDGRVKMFARLVLLPMFLLQPSASWCDECDGRICETNTCCSIGPSLNYCECRHRCQCCDSCPRRPTEVGQFEVDRLRHDDECSTPQPSLLAEDRAIDARRFNRIRSRFPAQFYSSLRFCACLSRWRL